MMRKILTRFKGLLFKSSKMTIHYWWVVVIGSLIGIVGLAFLRLTGYIQWLPFTGFEGVTLWDIAELFIIPVTLAIAAAYLAKLERKTSLENVKDNQREAALQNYFNIITNLILEKKSQKRQTRR